MNILKHQNSVELDLRVAIPLNELRMGNLFLNSQGNIQEATVEHFEYLANYHFTPHKEIAAIKLNTKILEALGFVQNINGNLDFRHKKNKMIRVCVCRDNNFRLITHLFDDLLKEPKVEFVHQLQNLYYALTGIELRPK